MMRTQQVVDNHYVPTLVTVFLVSLTSGIVLSALALMVFLFRTAVQW